MLQSRGIKGLRHDGEHFQIKDVGISEELTPEINSSVIPGRGGGGLFLKDHCGWIIR